MIGRFSAPTPHRWTEASHHPAGVSQVGDLHFQLVGVARIQRTEEEVRGAERWKGNGKNGDGAQTRLPLRVLTFEAARASRLSRQRRLGRGRHHRAGEARQAGGGAREAPGGVAVAPGLWAGLAIGCQTGSVSIHGCCQRRAEFATLAVRCCRNRVHG